MSDIRFNRWLHQSGTGGIHQDSSGNIGIGTSVPTVKVDIQGGDLKVGDQIFSSSGVSGLNITGGNVGINSESPTLGLDINKGANSGVYLGNPTNGYKLRANVSSSVNGGFLIEDESGVDLYNVRSNGAGTNPNTHKFYVNGNERLGITSESDGTSNLEIGNGNLVFSTAGTGIDFQNSGISSTTVASHVLDDYEEGTWDPRLFRRVDGNGAYEEVSDATYSTNWNAGWYTKIGNTILYGGCLRLTDKGSIAAADWVALGGFPFPAKGNTTPYGEKRGATALGQIDGLDGGLSGEVLVMNSPWQGAIYANLKFNRYGSTTATPVLGPDITDSFYINSFSGMYVVDD